MSTDRLTVPEAAEALGISQDAVYKRVERNKIVHERDADGRVYVYVDRAQTSQSMSTDSQSDTSENRYIASLEDQVRYLRDQLERAEQRDRENRRLLAAALERIPELEAPPDTPPESPRSPDTGSEDMGRPEPPPTEQRPSWWHRLFRG